MMTRYKRKSLLNRLKGASLNLLLKMVFYIFGVSMVLILIISAIPAFFIYLLVGDFSFDKQISEEYRQSVKHFDE